MTFSLKNQLTPDAIALANEKQAMLAAIVASSEDAIISKTTTGIITTWNPAAERIFGYCEAEAVGQSILLIVPQDRQSEENYIIGQILQGKKVEHFETLRLAKDGRQVPVSVTVSPIRNKEGMIIGASKVARDITDRQVANEKQAILAAIVATSDDAIISKTLRGFITSWNLAAERTFGYSEAEAIGQHISLIIPPDRLSEEDFIIGQIAKGKKVDHFETVRRAKDGHEVHLSVTVSPVVMSTVRSLAHPRLPGTFRLSKRRLKSRECLPQLLAVPMIRSSVRRSKERLPVGTELLKRCSAIRKLKLWANIFP
jgi:PAS domain S-box-containing protein